MSHTALNLVVTFTTILAIFTLSAATATAQPPIAFPAPVTTYRPVAPVPVVPAPAVTTYRPVAPAPVVTSYRPVAPAPVVTSYRPVYPAVVPAVAPVVVDTDIYVPGQPIRNLLRAITP